MNVSVIQQVHMQLVTSEIIRKEFNNRSYNNPVRNIQIKFPGFII